MQLKAAAPANSALKTAAPPTRTKHAPPTAPAPAETFERGEDVRVRYNPQDSTVMDAVETSVPRGDIGTDLSCSRITMYDGQSVHPDADGNYLFAPGTRGYQQVESYTSTQKALRLMEKSVGHPIGWAFNGPLYVIPHFQDGFNAFYLRYDKSTHFFDGKDDKAGRTIYSCESMDVVSHETGHAILDGMKPGLLGWWASTESEAFHESFGDVTAMLTAMQDEHVIDRLAAQTGGDLHKENIIAHLAEELSQGINDTVFNGEKPAGWTIRNANNALVYQDPKHLPKNPPDETKLGKEAHNFSRLFTGAVWDIMAGLVDRNVQGGQSPRDAIAAARDVMAPLYIRGVELGPNHMKKYRQMADAIIEADKHVFDGAHTALLTKVFADRGIRPANAVEAPPLPDIALAQPIKSEKDAERFLANHRQALGVPKDAPLHAAALYSNDRGETFVRYDYTQEIKVAKDLSTDLAGSLTVAFDRDGKLFHALWEPIDQERVDLAKDAIGFHFAEGDIHQGEGRMQAVKADGHPYAGYIEVTARGDRKLVRIPGAS